MAMATPMALTMMTLAKAKAAKTTTMMAAALVMRRPLRARPSVTARVLSPWASHSSWTRLREQDLVVHRQAEDDAEEEDGQRRLDGPWLEAEDAREVTILEDPHEGAERRCDGQKVRDDRLERQDHGPKEREEDDVRERRHERDGLGCVCGEEGVHVHVDGREAAHEERPVGDAPLRADGADGVAGFGRRGSPLVSTVSTCTPLPDIMSRAIVAGA